MRKLTKMLSVVLAVALMVTSVSMDVHAATADDSIIIEEMNAGESEISNEAEEAAEEMLTSSEVMATEAEEAGTEVAIEEADSEGDISEEEILLSDTEEKLSVADEEGAELEADSDILYISDTTPTSSGEGWSYNASNHTLELNGAVLPALDISCDVIIDVKPDSQIADGTTQLSAIYVHGDARDVVITSTAEEGKVLRINAKNKLISEDSNTNRKITFKGQNLCVVGTQTNSNSKNAAIECNNLCITEKARLELVGYKNVITCSKELVISGGATVGVDSKTGCSLLLKSNAKMTVSGTGSGFATSTGANYNDSIIRAESGSSIFLTDSAQMQLNKSSNKAPAISGKDASIFIGKAELQFTNQEGSGLKPDTPVIRAKEIINVYDNPDGTLVKCNGYYELRAVCNTNDLRIAGKPYLSFSTQPESGLAVKKGDAITLSAAAELKDISTTPNIAYQWYLDDQAIPGATGASLNLNTSSVNIGIRHVYCKATMNTDDYGTFERNSDIATVYVTKDGRTPKTDLLSLVYKTTNIENESEGWAWNADRKILTLTNYLQYYAGGVAVSLPKDSTIIMKGENVILNTNSTPIWTSGGLLVYGPGNMTLYEKTSPHYAINTGGTITLGANLTKGEKVTNSGTDQVKAVLDSDLGWYTVCLEGNNTPFLYFRNKPDTKVFTGSMGGEVPAIELDAVLLNTEDGSETTYEYQWYATNDWNTPTNNAQAVAGANGRSFSAPTTERGGKYYYCEIKATNNASTYSVLSDVYCVVVGAPGKTPVTSYQELGTASVDKSEYGYTFTRSEDGLSDVLRLDNVEVFIPFATASAQYKTAFWIKSNGNVTVELAEGSVNNVSQACGAIWLSGTNVESLTIKGKGTLNYQDGVSSYGMLFIPNTGVGTLYVSDGAVLNELYKDTDLKSSNLTVSGATYNFRNRSTPIGDIKVENGGKLYTSSDKTLSAKNITVDKTSEMSVDCSNPSNCALCVDEPQGKLSVGGTLYIASHNKYLLKIKTDGGSTLDRFILNDGARIISPNGISLEDLSHGISGGYESYENDAKHLYIVPGSFKAAKITSATAITGEIRVGATVSVGTVTPADATVTYQWQYAEAANAADDCWQDITGATNSTYTIDKEEYTGKYLRVKINGIVKYAGTVYSKAATPISADGATMVDFIADGFALGTYSRAPSLTLSYQNGFPEEVSLRVLAVDPSATIVMKNVTEGYTEKTDAERTINGAEGLMPVQYTGEGWNNNDIQITITSGEITKTYHVTLKTYGQATQIKFITSSKKYLVLMDDTHDIEHPLEEKGDGQSDTFTVTPGKTYTVAIFVDKDGWYPVESGCMSPFVNKTNEYLDDDSEVRFVSFTMPRGRMVKFDTTNVDIRAFEPDITADWAYEDVGGYHIAVDYSTSHSFAKDEGFDGEIRAELFDRNGNRIQLTDKGFYEFNTETLKGTVFSVDENGNKVSLDPSMSYKLRVWMNVADKEKCDAKEITLEAPILNMLNHQVVIERSTLTDTVANILVNEKAKAFKVEQYPSASVSKVEVVPDEHNVKVTVKTDANPGTVYAMVYHKLPGGKVNSDILTIQVTEPAGEVYVGLGETAGTLDIYKDENLAIPINTTNTVKAIESVSFVESNNSALSGKYAFEVLNQGIIGAGGRTVVVKPTGLPAATADQVDWASLAATYKGTFKAKLKVVLAGGQEYITDQYYTMTIGGTAPKAKVDALKFNSFYQGNQQPVNATSVNGAVLATVVDTSKTKGKVVACPSWLQLEGGGMMASIINNQLTNKKGSGKLYLNVVVDGYRIPAQVTASASAAYTVPKVKLSETTVTLPANPAKYVNAKGLTLMASDKKTDYLSLGITAIRVANSYDLSQMTEKNRQAYSLSKYFVTDSFSEDTGVFGLKKSALLTGNTLLSGKVLLIATVDGNSNQEIELPLTIKTQDVAKATIKMDRTKIALNPYLDDAAHLQYGTQKEKVKIVPSVSGLDLGSDGVVTIKVTDSKGDGDYSSGLSITKDENTTGIYTIKTNAATTAGTYLVTFTVAGISKPATVSVTVKGTVPTIKFGMKSVTLDRFLGIKDESYAKQKVDITLSDNSISRTYENFTYAVKDAKKQDATGAIQVNFNAAGTAMTVTPGSSAATGTYYVEVTYTMPSGKTTTATETVKVTGKLPTLKGDRKSVTLNPHISTKDCVKVKITSPDAYEYVSGGSVTVYEGKKIAEGSTILRSYANGVLTLFAGSDCKPGTNYKVVFSRQVEAYGAKGTASTEITVKIPKASARGKIAISQKVSTKGSLDVSRLNSSMQVVTTYSGWNADVKYPDGTYEPKVIWSVYAYDKQGKPYHCDIPGGQYAGTDGLVAKSTGTDPALDWFIDGDASPYGVTLKFNPNNDAIKYLPDSDGFLNLNYQIRYTTIFKDYLGTGNDYSVMSEVKFKVKSGTVKLSSVPNTVVLDRMNRYDSKVVKVQITDKDALDVNITGVAMSGNDCYDASLLYVGGGYAYVAIGWKNDIVPVTIKTGKQTLSFYTGLNYEGRLKANGSAVVVVNKQ